MHDPMRLADWDTIDLIDELERRDPEWLKGHEEFRAAIADRDRFRGKAEYYHDRVKAAIHALGCRTMDDLDDEEWQAGLKPAKIASPEADPVSPQRQEQPKRIERQEPSPASPVLNGGTAGETAEGRHSPRDSGRPSTSSELAPRHVKILDAIAWCERLLRKAEVERNIVAWMAGTSPTSSGYEKTLSSLRTGGYIEYPRGGVVALTDAGRGVAAMPATPPSRRELVEAIKRKLEPRHGRLLDAALAAPSLPISREELAQLADYSASSSGYEKSLSHLRTLGLFDYPARGQVTLGSLLQ